MHSYAAEASSDLQGDRATLVRKINPDTSRAGKKRTGRTLSRYGEKNKNKEKAF